MLNFMHHVVHGGDKVAEVNQHSEYILDKLEKEYLAVLSKTYVSYMGAKTTILDTFDRYQ